MEVALFVRQEKDEIKTRHAVVVFFVIILNV